MLRLTEQPAHPSILRRVTRWGLPSVMIALAAAGCGPAAPQAPTLDLGISPTPPTVGNARVMLELTDSTGAALQGVTVHVEGRLTGTEDVQTRREAIPEGAGRYVVSDFRFATPGEWVIDVVVSEGEGPDSRISRDVRVVGGGPS